MDRKTTRYSKLITYYSLFFFLVACGNNKSDYDASGIFETIEVIVSAQANGQIMAFDVEEGKQLSNNRQVGYIDTIPLHLKKMQLAATRHTVGSKYMDVNRQIASLEEQVGKQKSEQQRFENLVKANAANQKQLDDIVSQLQVLEKQLAAQREVLNNNNAGVTGESASIDIQIAQVDDQIKKSIITSPIEGTVLAKYAEPGEITTTGRALFKIADTKKMFLRAYITADQLTQIKQGQQVMVFADFGKDTKQYSGTINWVSDKAEFTPKTIQTRNERANLVYAVKISVSNDGYLKQGMYGEVRIDNE